MDLAAICSKFDVDHTAQIPFNIQKSFGHFLSTVKSNTYRKGLIVTHDIIKVITIVFVMGDVKAVGGTVSVCFVSVCNEQRPANSGGVCFPQGGLNLSRSQEKKIRHFHAATYVN